MTKKTYVIVAKDFNRTITVNEKIDVVVYADLSLTIIEHKNGKTITTLIPRESVHYIMLIEE